LAFSKSIVTDLLRDKLGFKGYVIPTPASSTPMAWGLEDKTFRARARGHQRRHRHLVGLCHNRRSRIWLDQGLISKERVNEATRRLLKNSSSSACREPLRRGQQGQQRDWPGSQPHQGLEVQKNQSSC